MTLGLQLTSDPASVWFIKQTSGAVISALVSFLVAKKTTEHFAKITAQGLRRDSIAGILEDISSKARRYWRSTGQDSYAEAELKELLDRLFYRIDAFFDGAGRSAGPSDDVTELALNLHMEVTGGQFETVTRTSDPSKAEQIKLKAASLRKDVQGLSLKARYFRKGGWVDRLLS